MHYSKPNLVGDFLLISSLPFWIRLLVPYLNLQILTILMCPFIMYVACCERSFFFSFSDINNSLPLMQTLNTAHVNIYPLHDTHLCARVTSSLFYVVYTRRALDANIPTHP